MVGPDRFELSTSRLSSARSNQLSYGPSPAAVARPDRKIENMRRNWARTLSTPSAAPTKRRVQEKRNEDGGEPQISSPASRWDVFQADREDLLAQISIEIVLRKEVIQPQVPLRLPCYDFTPVADPTVVACLLAVSAAPSGRTNSHGVTGGVYKARERIHRGMLIRDY